MNKSIFVITLSAMLFAANGWAQESNPKQEPADQWTVAQADHQARLDELIGIMAKEMATIRETGDRKERQALMITHRENMREAMSLMRDMGGMHMREVMAEHMNPGMASKTDSDRPRHRHKQMPIARPRTEMSDVQRLSDLENRLDMMQIMMESLLETYPE